MAADENHFRKALEEAASQRGDTDKVQGDTPNLTRQLEMRTVAEMNIVSRDLLDRMPKVRDLTVHDLRDLADEFSGVKTNNPKVAELTLDDLQDMESIFFDFKVAAGRELAGSGELDLAAVDVSCCCCTPCCCCAATDMSHTAA